MTAVKKHRHAIATAIGGTAFPAFFAWAMATDFGTTDEQRACTLFCSPRYGRYLSYEEACQCGHRGEPDTTYYPVPE